MYYGYDSRVGVGDRDDSGNEEGFFGRVLDLGKLPHSFFHEK